MRCAGLFFLIAFLSFVDQSEETNAVQNIYGIASDRIQSPLDRSNSLKSRLDRVNDYAKQQYKLVRARERSPSYVQSRRFHPEQFVRDNRDLRLPLSFQSPMSSSSYYYGSSADGGHMSVSSQEACRLTNNFCARDYQCCSGKCRCVRWSVMGKMSCWKKCF